MIAGQLRNDAWTSLRTLWREERWLPAGVAVAAIAYVLWVGLTGAALTFLLEAFGGAVTFRPWTSTTTVAVVVGVVLLVVGPAAVATVLVVDRLTNVNGNLRHGYRLRHPILLVGPPATVLAIGYVALVRTGAASWPVLAVLVAGGIWFLVRTAAYAYRVFSLSLPILADVLVFAAAFVFAAVTVITGAVAAGREPALTALLAGLAERTGVDALQTLHTATVTVGGVSLPQHVAAVVAVPVGLSAAYVGIQLAWSAVVRLWQPTVRRPELRTGQRYPAFARPTTNARSGDGRTKIATPAGATGPTAGGDTGASSEATATSSPTAGEGPADIGEEATAEAGTDETRTAGTGHEEAGEADDVSHTRVFTPPDDADLDAADGLQCPACGEFVDATSETCPSCGGSIGSS